MSKSTRRALDDLDFLIGRHDPESHSDGESLDVLLQLTLPIVLILALFVVTQLEAVENAFSRTKKQLNQVKDELIQTEEQLGSAQNEIKAKDEQLEWERSSAKASAEGQIRNDAIITFQEKYLREATDEVVKKEKKRLGIDDYRSAAPSSHSLSEGKVGKSFKDSSQRIYEIFKSPDSLETRLAGLDRQILAEFAKNLDKHFETHTHYRPWHREQMGNITPENREKYQRDLRARMDEIIKEAVDVQVKLISDAYDIPDWVTVEGSNERWDRAYELREGPLVERFRNLTLDGIVEKIEEKTGISIFPQTKATAEAMK